MWQHTVLPMGVRFFVSLVTGIFVVGKASCGRKARIKFPVIRYLTGLINDLPNVKNTLARITNVHMFTRMAQEQRRSFERYHSLILLYKFYTRHTYRL